MRTLLVLVLLVAGCSDPSGGHEAGEVVDKVYTPAMSGTGVGTGVCSGGGKTGSCTGVVTLHSSETWTLVLKACDPECDVWSYSATAEEWADHEVGDVYRFAEASR